MVARDIAHSKLKERIDAGEGKHPKPETGKSKPEIRNAEPQTGSLKSETRRPKPGTPSSRAASTPAGECFTRILRFTNFLTFGLLTFSLTD